MASLETSPLLPSQASGHPSVSKPFDLLGSTRYLLLGSWINVLLICVPLSFTGQWIAHDRLQSQVLLISWFVSSRGAWLECGRPLHDILSGDCSVGQGASSKCLLSSPCLRTNHSLVLASRGVYRAAVHETRANIGRSSECDVSQSQNPTSLKTNIMCSLKLR